MRNGFPLWLICLGDAGAAFLQRIIFFDTFVLQVEWATKLREWLFIKFGFHFTVDNEKKDSATKSTALYWV
jgi:hypothetical protein